MTRLSSPTRESEVGRPGTARGRRAELDAAAAIVTLLSRHLSFGLPTPVGFAASREGGRAAVHALLLPGSGINLDELGPEDLVGAIGRAPRRSTISSRAFRERGTGDLHRRRIPSATPVGPRSCGREWTGPGRIALPLGARPRTSRSGSSPRRRFMAASTGRHLLVQVHEATPKLTGITGWRRAKVADPADDFCGDRPRRRR